jgi:hypothetical protein
VTKRITLCALLGIGASPLCADWITVENDVTLRGVDYKKEGKGHVFTLENGKQIYLKPGSVVSHRKSPQGETVEFRGEQVTLRRKVKILQKEAKKREKSIGRDLERWARGSRNAEEAQKRFRELTAAEQQRFLTTAILKGSTPKVRALASRGLARFSDPGTVRTLSLVAVTDRHRSVRDTSLQSLKAIDSPTVTAHFVPFLKDRSPRRRVHAANAISVFPDPKAMPALIATLHLSWAGFGRGFTVQATQRAYVSDYELVSGGTGFSIVEVADPVIQTNTTGVALDVDVRRVELRTRLRTMKKISGQDFGTDVEKWQSWWQEKARSSGAPEVAGRED